MRRLLLALAASLQIGATTSSPPGFSVADGVFVEGQTFTPVATKSAVAKSYSKITFTVSPGTCSTDRYVQPAPVTITVSNSQLKVNGPAIRSVQNITYQPACTILVKIAAVRNASITRSTATIVLGDDELIPVPTYSTCAVEGGTCWISGTASVRYGANNTWAYREATGSIICNNATFGDPLPGVVKRCETTSPGTAPPPPPVPSPGVTSWVPAPVTVGGFACSKLHASLPKSGPCGANVVYRIIGTVQSSDAVPVTLYLTQFYQDASGNFPVNSVYDTTVVGYWPASDLIGIAPGASVS